MGRSRKKQQESDENPTSSSVAVEATISGSTTPIANISTTAAPTTSNSRTKAKKEAKTAKQVEEDAEKDDENEAKSKGFRGKRSASKKNQEINMTADDNARKSTASKKRKAGTGSGKTNKNKNKKKAKVDDEVEEDEIQEEKEEAEEEEKSDRKSVKKRQRKQKASKEAAAADDEDDSVDNKAKKAKGNNKRGNPVAPLPPPSAITFRRTVPNGLTLISWNVAGLRQSNRHGASDYLSTSNADIICLNEIKADDEIIAKESLALPNYYCYWHSSNTKKGYSGVSIFSKITPLNIVYGLRDIEGKLTNIDNEGRVITAEYEDFVMINSYIPNSGAELARLSYRTDIFDRAIQQHLLSVIAIEKKPIIWTGDLNVAHEPIDLHSPQTNKKSAGFTQQERDSFTQTLTSHQPPLIDVYRYLFPKEHDGCYTYWGYRFNARAKNRGWRVDYFIVSAGLKDRIVDMFVGSEVNQEGKRRSDHAPIWLHLAPAATSSSLAS